MLLFLEPDLFRTEILGFAIPNQDPCFSVERVTRPIRLRFVSSAVDVSVSPGQGGRVRDGGGSHHQQPLVTHLHGDCGAGHRSFGGRQQHHPGEYYLFVQHNRNNILGLEEVSSRTSFAHTWEICVHCNIPCLCSANIVEIVLGAADDGQELGEVLQGVLRPDARGAGGDQGDGVRQHGRRAERHET